jgi:tetratricopeptide (TPR) repeat protein
MLMPASLSLPLLLGAAFGLAAWLEPVFQQRAGNAGDSGNILTVLMGDSRRLFAQHFYVKADAYFHSGYYPSVFDGRPSTGKLRLAADAEAGHDAHGAHGAHEGCLEFLGTSRDWIDRFSRHFYPTEHRHLGEGGPLEAHAHGEDGHDDETNGAGTQEILPWLRMAAELDPQRAETYVVASFWLRSQLHKVDEAEQFLREGLRHNPNNGEILFELGRVYRENRQDNDRARNLWELGLKQWRATEKNAAEPNLLLYAQLLGNLAKLEDEEKRFAQALTYLEELSVVSPNKESLQRWRADLTARLAR